MLIDYLNDKQRVLIFAPGIEHGKYGNKNHLYQYKSSENHLVKQDEYLRQKIIFLNTIVLPKHNPLIIMFQKMEHRNI